MARERFPRYLAALAAKKLDQTFGNPGAPLAVVSTGAAFETLKQVLEENDLLAHVHLYKVAGAYARVVLGWLFVCLSDPLFRRVVYHVQSVLVSCEF